MMRNVGFLGLCLIACSPARAELILCNPADAPRSVALAYSADGVWTSEGWWSIDPEACRSLLSGPLRQRHYYYTLSGEPGYAGDGYAFCVTPEAFTLSGADGDCAAMGAEERPFGHIDTGETAESYSFTLPTVAAGPAPKADVSAPRADPAPAGLPEAAQTPAFVQGTMGEPFTVTGLMQGCGATEEFSGCTFYAEGWRWMAAEGAGSNPDALAAIAGLPVNTALTVTGDLLFYGDITAEAVIASIELAEPDAFAGLRAGLQGDWISEDDPANSFSIVGSEMTDLYAGEVTGQLLISVTDLCPDGTEAGPVLVQRLFGSAPEDAICLALVEVTPDRLEMSLVGRGNTLVYRRP